MVAMVIMDMGPKIKFELQFKLRPKYHCFGRLGRLLWNFPKLDPLPPPPSPTPLPLKFLHILANNFFWVSANPDFPYQKKIGHPSSLRGGGDPGGSKNSDFFLKKSFFSIDGSPKRSTLSWADQTIIIMTLYWVLLTSTDPLLTSTDSLLNSTDSLLTFTDSPLTHCWILLAGKDSHSTGIWPKSTIRLWCPSLNFYTMQCLCLTFVDLNSTYRVTKAVKERTSVESVWREGSFYINTSHSSPTFALGAGMQKIDFTNFAETISEKGKIIKRKTKLALILELGSLRTLPKMWICSKERHSMPSKANVVSRSDFAVNDQNLRFFSDLRDHQWQSETIENYWIPSKSKVKKKVRCWGVLR